MGSERGSSPSSSPAIGASTSSSATSSPSGSGKRNREPEDEVYLDNLHSHKRYLSEVLSLPSLNLLFLLLKFRSDIFFFHIRQSSFVVLPYVTIGVAPFDLDTKFERKKKLVKFGF